VHWQTPLLALQVSPAPQVTPLQGLVLGVHLSVLALQV
jgi:hypothetical protein